MPRSIDQQQHPRETSLAPYSEVVVWRRRFYVTVAAALFALIALAVFCAGTH